MVNRNRVAALFRRFPWMAKFIAIVYRISVPRYSAGVVGVLLDDEGRVFMVEHVFHPKHPWGLPGGWIGSEEPASALEREFMEETRLRVKAVRPLMVTKSDLWRHHIEIAFLLAADGATDHVELSPELTGYGWFTMDELPRLNTFNYQVLDAVRKLMEKDSAP